MCHSAIFSSSGFPLHIWPSTRSFCCLLLITLLYVLQQRKTYSLLLAILQPTSAPLTKPTSKTGAYTQSTNNVHRSDRKIRRLPLPPTCPSGRSMQSLPTSGSQGPTKRGPGRLHVPETFSKRAAVRRLLLALFPGLWICNGQLELGTQS